MKKRLEHIKKVMILLGIIFLCTGSHKTQIKFCFSVKDKFPEYFNNTKVLDVGSLDINGTSRIFFDSCDYTGIDIGPGPNVDIIKPVHKHRGTYDVVICCNMLEHDKYHKKSLKRMVGLLRHKGLMIIAVPLAGHSEHGTTDHWPESSPYTNDYYMNFTKEILIEELQPHKNFTKYEIKVYPASYDIFFWGIKK